MIRVYFLPVEVLDETESVAGMDIIHGALLECTDQADIRKLIMDTTDDEHAQLATLALDWRDPTPEEIALLDSQDFPSPDPGFVPENPTFGVEQRLNHVEAWLASRFPPPP